MREKRVVVISVTGAFRTGKSFLLNYLIKYLTHLESDGEGDWLGGEEDELTGFTWRRGAGTVSYSDTGKVFRDRILV